MIRWLAALLLFAALLPAQQAGLYLRYSQWSTDLEGDVDLDAGGLWDLSRDLALESDSPVGYGVVYRGIKHRFSAELFESSLDNTFIAGEDLEIGGVPVEPGTVVTAAMDLQTLEVEYWYHLVSVPTFRTGLILGGEMYDVTTRIQDTEYSQDEVVPYIGLGITAMTPKQGIYVDVALTVGEYQDTSHLSGRVESGLDLFSGFGLYAGLRMVRLELSGDSSSWDLDTSSYYFGAHLHF
jgi:hypothetical protein